MRRRCASALLPCTCSHASGPVCDDIYNPRRRHVALMPPPLTAAPVVQACPSARRRRCRRLVAQLARTEEAAKRALLRADSSAQGGAAAKLLSLERDLMRTTADKLAADGGWLPFQCPSLGSPQCPTPASETPTLHARCVRSPEHAGVFLHAHGMQGSS